jgi:hypothetical protein
MFIVAVFLVFIPDHRIQRFVDQLAISIRSGSNSAGPRSGSGPNFPMSLLP